MRSDTLGTRTLLRDALGSTVALSDSLGGITTQYTYEPFGTVTPSGELSSNATAFTGREADGTGLYYYRARYYDSQLQRFGAQDPLSFDADDPSGVTSGLNPYSYVANSPTNYIVPRCP
jgi:RHS repeat-associated protein